MIGNPNRLKPPPQGAPISTDMKALVGAIDRQTQAMNALVESNARIIECFIEALKEEQDDEDREPDNYLDSTPL